MSDIADHPEWVDPEYLQTVQYATSTHLANRSSLHERYSTSPVPFRAWEAKLIDWPTHGADVLEVGGGPGRFWEFADLPRSLRLTLTDLSPGMTTEAQLAARTHGYASVHAQPCDAQALPFEDDSFDIVVANHMLYHVPDPQRALHEIRRVLRPAGTALIATNGRRHMRQLFGAVHQVFGESADTMSENFGIESGELLLRDVFDSITWHSFVNALIVTDPIDVLAYATSFPPGDTADDQQRGALLELFRAEFRDGGGTMRIDTRAGAFVCR